MAGQSGRPRRSQKSWPRVSEKQRYPSGRSVSKSSKQLGINQHIRMAESQTQLRRFHPSSLAVQLDVLPRNRVFRALSIKKISRAFHRYGNMSTQTHMYVFIYIYYILCIYIYTCICMYIYIYTYTYWYVHTPLHKFACVFSWVSNLRCENSADFCVLHAFFAHCPHGMPWRRLCLRSVALKNVSTMNWAIIGYFYNLGYPESLHQVYWR